MDIKTCGYFNMIEKRIRLGKEPEVSDLRAGSCSLFDEKCGFTNGFSTDGERCPQWCEDWDANVIRYVKIYLKSSTLDSASIEKQVKHLEDLTGREEAQEGLLTLAETGSYNLQYLKDLSVKLGLDKE